MKLFAFACTVMAIATQAAAAGDVKLASVASAPDVTRHVAPLQATALARQILLRIDDATRSGNYSVMRELAAPSLKASVSDDALSKSMGLLRQQKIELLPAAVLEPMFDRALITRNGTEMELSGRLPTSPQQITFDFKFDAIEGAWLLVGLTVGLADAIPAMTAQPETIAIKPSLR